MKISCGKFRTPPPPHLHNELFRTAQRRGDLLFYLFAIMGRGSAANSWKGERVRERGATKRGFVSAANFLPPPPPPLLLLLFAWLDTHSAGGRHRERERERERGRRA